MLIGNWTAEDEEQAEAYADEVMERRRLTMPPDCCSSCGDYAGPGREKCSRCERDSKPANIPEDNWRRSVRYPRSRHR